MAGALSQLGFAIPAAQQCVGLALDKARAKEMLVTAGLIHRDTRCLWRTLLTSSNCVFLCCETMQRGCEPWLSEENLVSDMGA